MIGGKASAALHGRCGGIRRKRRKKSLRTGEVRRLKCPIFSIE